MPDLVDQLFEAAGVPPASPAAPGPVPDSPASRLVDRLFVDAGAHAEVAAPAFARESLRNERTWQDVGPQLKQKYGVDPEQFRQQYQLDEARAVQKGEGVGVLESFLRSSVPIGSAVRKVREGNQYAEAKKRFAENKATADDAATIARYERLQEIDQQIGSTIGGKVVQGLGAAPAIVGESLLGGAAVGRIASPAASTLGSVGRSAAAAPLMPSLYAESAVQKNLAEGRSATDWRGYPSSIAYGAAQNVVLGRVFGRQAPGVAGVVGTGLKGTAEQTLVDAAAGAVDEVLPKQWQTGTRGGSIGMALRGEWGEAMKHVAAQAVTFTAFAAMHYRSVARASPSEGLAKIGGVSEQPTAPIFDSFKSAVDWMQGRGLPRDRIVQAVGDIHGRIEEAMAKNPDLTRSEARALFDGMPDNPLKKYGHAIADSLPEKAPQRPELPAGVPVEPPKVTVTGERPPVAPESPPVPPTQSPAGAEIAPQTRSQEPIRPVLVTKPLIGGRTDLLAKIRANQAVRGPTAVPAPPRIGGKSPIERVLPRTEPPIPATLESLKAAGVSDPEIAAVRATLAGKTLREAAAEAGVTHQAVAKRLAKVGERIGLEKPEWKARIEDVLATHAIEEIGEGRQVDFGELSPVVAERGGQKALTAEERIRAEIKQLGDEWMEAGQHGPVPDARARELTARGTALAEALDKAQHRLAGKNQADQGGAVEAPPPEAAAGKPAGPPSPQAVLNRQRDSMRSAKIKVATNPWIKVELEAARDGTVTFAAEIRNRGGIDPKSLSKHEREVAAQTFGAKRWQDVPIFKDSKGKRGRIAIDEMAGEIGRRFMPDRAEMHGADQLMQLAEAHAPVEQGTAHADRILQEHQAKELEHFKEQTREILKAEQPGLSDAEVEARIEAAVGGGEANPDAESLVGHGSAEFNPAEFDHSPLDAAGVENATAGIARRFGGVRGRKGALTVDFTNVADAVRVAVDEWSKLRGQQFPATTRVNEPIADRMAAAVAAKAYAEAATDYVMQAIFGKAPAALQAKLYTAHLESRLNFMRGQGHAAISLIGPDSPIKTAAEFRQIVQSAEFREYLQRWKAIEVPIMNKHYRDSQGLGPNQPIHTATQLPDYPINLVRLKQDGSPTAVGSGGQRIHPERVTQRRFGFSKKASGEAPFGYETDPRKALLAAHEQGAAAAARANLDREIVDQQQGAWGQPGKPIPAMPDGTAMVAVRHVNPESGTQVAKPRETTLYVNPKILDDYHNAIAVGSSFRIPVVTPTLGVATQVSVMSTVEAAYHSFNIIRDLAHPYVIRNLLNEFWTAAKPLLQGELPHLSDEQLQRYMTAAEIGGTKEKGFQAGFLVPDWLAKKHPTLAKLDVTRWASEALDMVDRMMRLAKDGAFEQAAKAGLAENTAANKRDFLNTLGNYKQWSQAMLVRVLRGTGAGPFATASINSPVQAIRSLWASSGMTATSPTAQARLRVHVMLKIGAALGAAAFVNWLAWGRPDGDDSTPFGGIKLGEHQGRTYYIDPMRLLGPRRGLHVTGGEALIEGNRVGATDKAITHRAAQDVTGAFVHPAAGPGVQFGYTAVKGKNLLGVNLAGRPDPGVPQEWENLKAALKNANPTLAELMLADRVGPNEKMPFFPLFGRKTSDEGEVLVGRYPGQTPPETAFGKLAAPYIGSRKKLSMGTLRGLMEKEAAKR